MLQQLEPTIAQIRENPLSYPIEAITLRPDIRLDHSKENLINKGVRLEVEYKVGHILYFSFKERFDIFEELLKRMLKQGQ